MQQKPLQNLFSISKKVFHSDIQWSDDLRKILETICRIIGVKYTMPERFLGHRFLSAHTLAVDTQRLFDAFTLFYFAFIKDTKEVERYKYIYQEVLKRKEVYEKSLEELQKQKAKLQMKKK